MKITFVTRKFRNVERNVHCDVLHVTPDRVARLVLDCNGVFAIKAYGQQVDSRGWFSRDVDERCVYCVHLWIKIFINSNRLSSKCDTLLETGFMYGESQGNPGKLYRAG